LAWSGDSKRIYLSVRNDSIYVFDVSTGNILKSFGLGNGISSMAVSSDEKMLAYGDDNAYVKVIDLTTEKYIFNSMLYISSGYYGILDLEFDKNNNYLSAGCGDFNAWVFDTKKWSQKTYRGKCKYGASIVNKTQFSNNINYLILTLVRFIKVTDIASGMEIKLYTDIYDSNNVSNNSYRSSVIAKNDSFIIAVTDYGEIMRLKSWIVTDVKDIKTITQDIKIYPNPSSNKATIEYVSDNLSETSINIFDINSKLVYHDNITSIPGKNQYSFHVNQLVSGTYWVVIKIGDKILNTKFVMER